MMSMSRLRSLLTTILLWTYFMGAFVAGYFLVFVVAGIAKGRRGIAWALGHYAHFFLGVVRLLVPKLRFALPDRKRLGELRGSVVVCNHLSFLDPLLLLSILPCLITIVRPSFFRVPIFGWLLRGAGFLGPDLFAEGSAWIARVDRHLRQGGNLLIFPEGTRSRDGRLSPFKKGAFYLAKHLAAPIVVLRISGTDTLFPPGHFAFATTPGQVIEVAEVATIDVASAADATTHELTSRVRSLFETSPSPLP